MSSSTTISVSIPISLNILIESNLAKTGMTRSVLVRTAIEMYLGIRATDEQKQHDTLSSISKDIHEIKEYMKNK